MSILSTKEGGAIIIKVAGRTITVTLDRVVGRTADIRIDAPSDAFVFEVRPRLREDDERQCLM